MKKYHIFKEPKSNWQTRYVQQLGGCVPADSANEALEKATKGRKFQGFDVVVVNCGCEQTGGIK